MLIMIQIVIHCITSFSVIPYSFFYPPYFHILSTSSNSCFNYLSTCDLRLISYKKSLRRSPSTVVSEVSFEFGLRCALTAMWNLSSYLLIILRHRVRKNIYVLYSFCESYYNIGTVVYLFILSINLLQLFF